VLLFVENNLKESYFSKIAKITIIFRSIFHENVSSLVEAGATHKQSADENFNENLTAKKIL
jgi:hypothetical protein